MTAAYALISATKFNIGVKTSGLATMILVSINQFKLKLNSITTHLASEPRSI